MEPDALRQLVDEHVDRAGGRVVLELGADARVRRRRSRSGSTGSCPGGAGSAPRTAPHRRARACRSVEAASHPHVSVVAGAAAGAGRRRWRGTASTVPASEMGAPRRRGRRVVAVGGRCRSRRGRSSIEPMPCGVTPKPWPSMSENEANSTRVPSSVRNRPCTTSGMSMRSTRAASTSMPPALAKRTKP